MFRLVASDLDGTLLRSDKTISGKTEQMLSSLCDRGVLFVPSTGRTHLELPDPIMRVAQLRYAITCNGGGVYDFEEQRYIYSFTIDKPLGVRVLEACASLPVYPTIVCNGNRHILTDARGKVSDYVIARAAPGIVEKSHRSTDLVATLQETTDGLQKAFLYSKDEKLTPLIVDELRNEFPELRITTSGPIYVEVNASGIDKGRTLGLLCEHVGIPIEESVAFGDAANDMAMLRAAGLAIVPQNGTDEVKAAADIVCESCNDDGVRKTLERLANEGTLPALGL